MLNFLCQVIYSKDNGTEKLQVYFLAFFGVTKHEACVGKARFSGQQRQARSMFGKHDLISDQLAPPPSPEYPVNMILLLGRQGEERSRKHM